jgi:hypothetical protein
MTGQRAVEAVEPTELTKVSANSIYPEKNRSTS